MKQYTKSDLLKLKDSKPVPIIAHSHELVVPVVYANMAKKFLEKKGITLPLTHKELNSMKKEAQSLAKGGNVKNVKGQQQVATQKVIINLGNKRRRIKKKKAKQIKEDKSYTPFTPPNTPNPPIIPNRMYPTNYFNQPLRDNNFAMIRPYSANTSFFQPDKPKDKEKEIEEYKKAIEEEKELRRKEKEFYDRMQKEAEKAVGKKKGRKTKAEKEAEEEKEFMRRYEEERRGRSRERASSREGGKTSRELSRIVREPTLPPRYPPELERQLERIKRDTEERLRLPSPLSSEEEEKEDPLQFFRRPREELSEEKSLPILSEEAKRKIREARNKNKNK